MAGVAAAMECSPVITPLCKVATAAQVSLTLTQGHQSLTPVAAAEVTAFTRKAVREVQAGAATALLLRLAAATAQPTGAVVAVELLETSL